MSKSIVLAATLLLFAATPVPAQIYHWVDAGDDVHYSDTPPPSGDAEIVEFADLPVVDSPPGVQRGLVEPAQPLAAGPIYPVLNIAVPAPGETVWADDGQLEIAVATKPPLRKEHAFVYKLDGELRAGPTNQHSVTLGKVFRGTHTVSVTVVDGSGDVIQSSLPVTVHVKHHTIIN